MSYGNDAEVILKAIAADPACVIANAHAAARLAAVPYLQAAKKYMAQANEREWLYVWAIEAWATGDIKQAIAYHETIAFEVSA